MYVQLLEEQYFKILSDFMAYSRGSSDDYDRYARVTNDPGWSWQNIQKYIRMVRHYFSIQLSQVELKYYAARKVHATC
jgi:choline dehydrogenase-like flavoprotein